MLLHDVAKPRTIQRRDGTWTYYGHDKLGAEIARAVLGRSGLAEVAVEMGHRIDVGEVAWLIREHLFWLTADVGRVTDRAVAQRFLRDDLWGEDLPCWRGVTRSDPAARTGARMST